jgi:hypothetical protein
MYQLRLLATEFRRSAPADQTMVGSDRETHEASE